MISGNNFIWLHLPKTGGTSTASLFRNLKIPDIQIDPDTEDSKHESIETRLGQLKATPKQLTVITSRRLASWLLSDWHHKTIKMGLNIPFEPTKSGLFYSLRLGGTWVAADYWLHYFRATCCDRVVRLENLEQDSNNLVLPLLPAGTPNLEFPERNTNQYKRQPEHFFSARDLKRIYSNNPTWSEWEQTIYGNQYQIDTYRRFKSKLKSLKYLDKMQADNI